MKTYPIYIGEVAGKDSISAIHRFIRESSKCSIIPSIVLTRTEYGNLNSYYDSISFLRSYAQKHGSNVMEPVIKHDELLWNSMCIKYQHFLNLKYGFWSPCVPCHLFTHLLRCREYQSMDACGLITGERLSHSGIVKLNQHPIVIDCFKKILEHGNVRLVQPLLDEKNTAIVDHEIENDFVVKHANDVKCILSGNLDASHVEMSSLKAYLNDFLYPVGIYVIDRLLAGSTIHGSDFNQFIMRLLKDG